MQTSRGLLRCVPFCRLRIGEIRSAKIGAEFELKPEFEPRLASLSAAIGDPTRARTLARLFDGRLHSAGELARHAGVSPATMSAHLKLLVNQGLARVREQGRHRYFGLADSNVAHALEALMRLCDGPSSAVLASQQQEHKLGTW